MQPRNGYYQNNRFSNHRGGRQPATDAGGNGGTPAIRAGLSVQELKAMTAMRVSSNDEQQQPLAATAASGYSRPQSNVTSSYQTATPQQLQAAGIQAVVQNSSGEYPQHPRPYPHSQKHTGAQRRFSQGSSMQQQFTPQHQPQQPQKFPPQQQQQFLQQQYQEQQPQYVHQQHHKQQSFQHADGYVAADDLSSTGSYGSLKANAVSTVPPFSLQLPHSNVLAQQPLPHYAASAAVAPAVSARGSSKKVVASVEDLKELTRIRLMKDREAQLEQSLSLGLQSAAGNKSGSALSSYATANSNITAVVNADARSSRSSSICSTPSTPRMQHPNNNSSRNSFKGMSPIHTTSLAVTTAPATAGAAFGPQGKSGMTGMRTTSRESNASSRSGSSQGRSPSHQQQYAVPGALISPRIDVPMEYHPTHRTSIPCNNSIGATAASAPVTSSDVHSRYATSIGGQIGTYNAYPLTTPRAVAVGLHNPNNDASQFNGQSRYNSIDHSVSSSFDPATASSVSRVPSDRSSNSDVFANMQRSSSSRIFNPEEDSAAARQFDDEILAPVIRNDSFDFHSNANAPPPAAAAMNRDRYAQQQQQHESAVRRGSNDERHDLPQDAFPHTAGAGAVAGYLRSPAAAAAVVAGPRLGMMGKAFSHSTLQTSNSNQHGAMSPLSLPWSESSNKSAVPGVAQLSKPRVMAFGEPTAAGFDGSSSATAGAGVHPGVRSLKPIPPRLNLSSGTVSPGPGIPGHGAGINLSNCDSPIPRLRNSSRQSSGASLGSPMQRQESAEFHLLASEVADFVLDITPQGTPQGSSSSQSKLLRQLSGSLALGAKIESAQQQLGGSSCSGPPGLSLPMTTSAGDHFSFDSWGSTAADAAAMSSPIGQRDTARSYCSTVHELLEGGDSPPTDAAAPPLQRVEPREQTQSRYFPDSAVSAFSSHRVLLDPLDQ